MHLLLCFLVLHIDIRRLVAWLTWLRGWASRRRSRVLLVVLDEVRHDMVTLHEDDATFVTPRRLLGVLAATAANHLAGSLLLLRIDQLAQLAGRLLVAH